jgi:hypothetical protein
MSVVWGIQWDAPLIYYLNLADGSLQRVQNRDIILTYGF